jgi:predicted nucleic acid-binding protein
MLGISYTTLWRIRKKLAMFTTEKKLKNYYSEEDIKEIELQLKKENACRI